MAKPITFTVKQANGTALTSQEIIMGAIDTIATNDPVSILAKGPFAQPIMDNGVIARFRYFKTYFTGTQSETVIYNAVKAGNAPTSTDIVADEIIVDLDDPRTTKPELIRTQDEQMLQTEFASRFTSYMNSALRERQIRFYEALRVTAKVNAGLADGITRVVDTTDPDLDDVFYTQLWQNGISSLVDHFEDIFTKVNGDALGIDEGNLIGVARSSAHTRFSNTQAYLGGSDSQGQLEKGSLSVLSNVEFVKHGGMKKGIDGFVLVRGTVQCPIANIEEVRDPIGNFTRMWLRYDLPTLASTNASALFTYVIAFGDPAVINA